MKKYLLTSLAALISINAHAWTLGSSSKTGFPVSDIKIKIAGNSCVNAGFTPSTMETLVKDAVEEYWAKVPTSSLELTSSGVSALTVTADDLTTAANKTDANTILVGCSSDATTFSSASILAVGGIGCTNAGVCRAAVLMNDTATTQLDTLDRTVILATFAHELGHALGLGHTSDKNALMYYSASNKTQKSLAQDDIDGISYLYPTEKKLGGLAGACGTIDTTPRGGPNNFVGSMFLGMVIILLANFAIPRIRQRI